MASDSGSRQAFENVIGCGGGEHCVCQPGYGHKKNMLLQTPIAVPLTDKSKEELVRIVEMMQEDLRWYVDERNRLLASAPAVDRAGVLEEAAQAIEKELDEHETAMLGHRQQFEDGLRKALQTIRALAHQPAKSVAPEFVGQRQPAGVEPIVQVSKGAPAGTVSNFSEAEWSEPLGTGIPLSFKAALSAPVEEFKRRKVPVAPLMSDETFKQRADEENGQMVSVCSLPSERNSMTREQAIEIARHCAKAKPQSYYSEPFQPHEWVIDAILLGVRLHGAQYVPAESAAPERDSQKVDPLADRPTFSTPHAASLVESIKTTVSSRTTTNGPCYDPLSPADAGKELRALSAKWRPKGVHIYESDGASRDPSCKVCGQDYSDPRHNTDKAECADELDAVLALLNG
jgi:hypothetical protein